MRHSRDGGPAGGNKESSLSLSLSLALSLFLSLSSSVSVYPSGATTPLVSHSNRLGAALAATPATLTSTSEASGAILSVGKCWRILYVRSVHTLSGPATLAVLDVELMKRRGVKRVGIRLA